MAESWAEASGRARGLLDNDRAESLPVLGWLVWGLCTLIIHWQADDPAKAAWMVGAVMVGVPIVVVVVCIGLENMSRRPQPWFQVVEVVCLLVAVVGFLSSLAVGFGPTWPMLLIWCLPPVVYAGALLAAVVTGRYVTEKEPVQVVAMPQAAEPVPVDPFESWPLMRGAQYMGREKVTDTGVAQRIELPPAKPLSKMLTLHEEWASFSGKQWGLPTDAEMVDLLPVKGFSHIMDVLIHTVDFHEEPQAWPFFENEEVNFWEPIPFAILRSGEVIDVDMVERNLFLGSAPGGGKSWGQSLPIAAAAMHPGLRLLCLDFKQADLAMWKRRSEAYVGRNIDDAIDVLKMLDKMSTERTEALADYKISKIHDAPEGEFEPVVLAIDELAAYATTGTDKQRTEFDETAQRVGNVGRAAGISLVAATQRPVKPIISPNLLAVFQTRVAFRCADKAQSAVVLGGYGADASEIPGGREDGGKCHVNTERRGRRARTYKLSPTEAWAIADRIEESRHAPAPVLRLAPRVESPQLPDGSLISGWQRAVWEQFPSTPATAAEISKTVPGAASDKTMLKVFPEWERRGWIKATPSGKGYKWHRTSEEVAA